MKTTVATVITMLFRPLGYCSNRFVVTVMGTLGRHLSLCAAINLSYCVSNSF